MRTSTRCRKIQRATIAWGCGKPRIPDRQRTFAGMIPKTKTVSAVLGDRGIGGHDRGLALRGRAAEQVCNGQREVKDASLAPPPAPDNVTAARELVSPQYPGGGPGRSWPLSIGTVLGLVHSRDKTRTKSSQKNSWSGLNMLAPLNDHP
jgi:hypothetical protein